MHALIFACFTGSLPEACLPFAIDCINHAITRKEEASARSQEIAIASTKAGVNGKSKCYGTASASLAPLVKLLLSIHFPDYFEALNKI